MEKILILGSIAYDYIMDFEGDFNDNLSSEREKKVFNLAVMPHSKLLSFGGTAGNISYNLGLLGGQAIVITAVGKDFIDLGYEKKISKLPSLKFEGDIYENEFSANAYMVNDRNHNQIIIFHQGAMRNSPKIKLKEKKVSKESIQFATVSPDNYEAMVNWARELHTLGIPFMLDPGQVTPAFEKEILKELIPFAEILIGNEFEIEMISQKMECTLEDLKKLTKNLIITKGEKGSELYQNAEIINIPISIPEKVVDTTGAGDGFRSGLLYGLANKCDMIKSMKIGAITSSFVVETVGPQTQQYNLQDVKERYKKTFEEEI